MSVKNKTVKDKTALDFNYITGKLDLVRKFNADRIVTHERTNTGAPLMEYDIYSNSFVAAGPKVVVDNEGNVVVCGS